MSKQKLISPEFLKRLELLEILSKKKIRGNIKGERSSLKRGRSVEFSDYRNYVPGDEIKIIDWNIYGRLDKLFVKLFTEEEELILYILIDRSLSMDFGNPNKLEYAKKIAASLSYISLAEYDRVGVGIIDEKMSHYQSPIRGKNQVFKVFNYLENIKPQGQTSLKESIKGFTLRKLRPGFVVIISDFFDPDNFILSLKQLLFQKYQLFLIQILDREEIEPTVGGDVKLLDVETGQLKEVTITDILFNKYKENLSSFCNYIEDFCKKVGVGYLRADTSIPFEELVLKYFRIGGIVK